MKTNTEILKYVLQILFISVCQISYSQTVLNSAYNPAVGDSIKIKSVDTTGVFPGPGGENQMWNFSNIILLQEESYEAFVVPSATPYFSQFQNSDIASVNAETPPLYHYYWVRDSAWSVLGYADIGGVLRYTTPLVRNHYPVFFGSHDTTVYYGISVWGNVTKHFSGKRTFSGDGYGTISLPIGTFSNVLRVLTIDDSFDTTIIGGVVVGTNHSVVTYYNWYRGGYKFPVFSIVEVVTTQNPPWKVAVITQKSIPIGIIRLSANIPSGHRLYENYPNPFNSQTEIKFDIARRTLVTVTIYDVKGSQIDMIVSDTFSAGTYSVNWEAGSYSSGVYFCRIETEDYVSSMRMVLLK